MSKRSFKIFDAEDVAAHKSSSSCWVSRNGRVYDITSFLPDHPGGDDIVLKYAGQDIGAAMADKTEHEHSDSAYEMIDDFCIGRLGSDENIVDENWVATDDFHPDDTEVEKDFQKHQFIDLRKPLLRQVWEANFSKQYYLRQIHQPRHVPEPARMFGPSYLEVFTRTKWFVVPIIWLPIAGYLFFRSAFQFVMPLAPFTANPALPFSKIDRITTEAYAKTILCFFLGNVIWTILEYVLHRLRLVMPPVLFAALEWPFTRLAYKLFPVAVANGIISGAFLFYVLYDCMHYALHHTQLPTYLREMKKYHLGHHYKNYELGFGVTSKFWDIVFNTYLPV
ncbi:fatty acid alpha-hydroxylase [Marasmius crinis-equi]|uniref:Ceramide very long chain fatty acid hydroxylase n=1 Tax=Marasmius crinis-equi TaxID=585013 RepID=A0ABR3FL69_9AGAR